MDEAKIPITSRVHIPSDELRFSFSRSSGPGGQNVNKVSSRVTLSFDVHQSKALSNRQRESILVQCRRYIQKGGLFSLSVQESRSQSRNREMAVERFVEIIRAALTPKKRRIPTKISRTKKLKRVEAKRRRSDVKKMRQSRFEND